MNGVIRKSIFGCLFLWCAVALPMFSALLAYDGFKETDYMLTGISGQNPTIYGFTNAWSGNGSVVNAKIEYQTVRTEGILYRRNNGAATRMLDVSLTGPFGDYLDGSDKIGSNTLYVSFLITSPNNTASGYIELQNAGSRAIRLGINNGVWSRRIGVDGWSTLSGAPAVVAGMTNLVVFCVDFNAGGALQYYKVWINPTSLGGSEPVQDASFSSATRVNVDSVMMGLYFSADAEMDELRFGETYADVTPIEIFPAADLGWINVKDYLAYPDDDQDDTAAIQKAISENIGDKTSMKTIYFPSGVYNISSTLTWTNTIGEWKAYLRLKGAGRDNVTLKLADNICTDMSVTQAMLYTASSGTTSDGGGNTAFANYIEDMTLDMGTNNAAAVGINYIASNVGAVRRVRILSSDNERKGVAGILLNRISVGPALLDDVIIEGCDYGMDFSDQNKYAMTARDITLRSQRVAGIRNNQNAFYVHRLYSSNSVPVLSGNNQNAHTVILDAICVGGDSGTYGIIFQGGLLMRNTTFNGYLSAPIRNNNTGTDAGSSSISEYVSHAVVSRVPNSPSQTIGLPVTATPVVSDDPYTNWVKVASFNSAGIQLAINTAAAAGKKTIYFPSGQYNLNTPVIISGSVQRLLGNHAYVNWSPSTFYPAVFIFTNMTGSDITCEQFIFSDWAASYAGYTYLHDETATPIVFRDILQIFSDGNSYRHTQTKNIWLENCALGGLMFSNANVWAWQLDPENENVIKLKNNGGTLWVVGLKTEWSSTSIETCNRGSTEVLGAMFYVPFGFKSYTIPAVSNDESQIALSMTCYGDFNDIFVRDVYGGVTHDFTYSDSQSAGHPRDGRTIPLYTAPIPEPLQSTLVLGIGIMLLYITQLRK